MIPTAIAEGFQHGGQKALWRSSMLLARVWFSFSLCVVEGISWGGVSFGIICFMFPLDLGFENTSKCLGGVFAAR